MNRILKLQVFILVTLVFLTILFPLSSAAQKPGPPSSTIQVPYDFTGWFYTQHGVKAREIIWRRSGADGLSVIDKAQVFGQRDVRIIATVPTYDQGGEPSFWYPLGTLAANGFTDDENGFMAMQMAKFLPIYIFPDEKFTTYNAIANTRQAPLMDNTLAWLVAPNNPLGLREVFLVNYTTKVHTAEGVKMMEYMGGKNGLATNGMPLIKTLEDLRMLHAEEYVTMTYGDSPNGANIGHYVMAPVIADPTKGAIAKDAFLWISTRDGNPLKGEWMFFEQFGCLQKTGAWCM